MLDYSFVRLFESVSRCDTGICRSFESRNTTKAPIVTMSFQIGTDVYVFKYFVCSISEKPDIV
jgi:hypothetical protein